MRWHGYRSENRYQVFQCLTHTLGLEAVQWRVLDQAHRKRNLAEYEGELDVDDALVEALVRVGRTVAGGGVALGPVAGGCSRWRVPASRGGLLGTPGVAGVVGAATQARCGFAPASAHA